MRCNANTNIVRLIANQKKRGDSSNQGSRDDHGTGVDSGRSRSRSQYFKFQPEQEQDPESTLKVCAGANQIF